ncbi:MAG: DUF192 domain-containing protein [Acidobacteriota bacterium]|nr:DUF192 domain-containing protein [Acidobacteriota bacterium]
MLLSLMPMQRAVDRARFTLADGAAVTLEVADTEAKRQRGLMFRERLAETEGMIFVFEQPGFYPFWMQNCRIPLDILWLDSSFRIVSIVESAQPCRKAGCEPPCAAPDCPTYAPEPGTAAKYVVELASGFTRRHSLRKSQILPITLPAR